MSDKEQGLKVFQVLAGGPWGGGGVVVLALTKQLLQAGFQVSVLCLSDEVSNRFADAGAEVVTFPHWRREIHPLFDLLVFYEIYRYIKRGNYDIVHTHTSKGGFLGRFAAKLARTPVIIHTVHGFAFHEFTRSIVKNFYLLLEKLATRACDMLISVNNEDRITAIEAGIVHPNKIVTIINGIDLSQFSSCQNVTDLRKQLGFPEKGPLVGTVGRLADQKGYEYLLQSIPDVLRYNPETYFIFVGDGPLIAEFQAYAENNGIVDRCRFLGFRRDVPQLLNCFDIFVLPSLWEGLSITLLEAMGAGKAIVATDIKGNREVITHGVNGYLCQPMNSKSLATGINDLIANREKARQLGRNALHDAYQRYDERIMLNNTMELYRKLSSKISH